MKNLLLILVCLFPNLCMAQRNELDSLEQKVIKIDLAVNTMHGNMVKTSNRYIIGAIITVAGAAVMYIGSTRTDVDTSKNITRAGGGVAVLGFAVSVSAFAHLGQGGRRRR